MIRTPILSSVVTYDKATNPRLKHRHCDIAQIGRQYQKGTAKKMEVLGLPAGTCKVSRRLKGI
jgi:hypothetical protein